MVRDLRAASAKARAKKRKKTTTTKRSSSGSKKRGLSTFEKAQAAAGATNIGAGPGSGAQARQQQQQQVVQQQTQQQQQQKIGIPKTERQALLDRKGLEGTLTEASKKQKFAMTPAGQFLQGVKSSGTASDVQGREFLTLPIAQQAGKGAAWLATAIGGVRTGGALSKAIKPGTIQTTLKAGGVSANAATARVASSSLLKAGFTVGALAIAGSWIGAVAFGLWGQAESPESVQFFKNKYLVPEAQRTEDWSAVLEAEQYERDAVDLSVWEKVALNTPLAGIIGSKKKIEGVARGVQVSQKYTADQRFKQENGLDENAMWEKRKADQDAMYKEQVDYSIEQQALRQKNKIAIQKAADEARDEVEKNILLERIKLYDKRDSRQREEDAKERERIAEFWLAYDKQKFEIEKQQRENNALFWLEQSELRKQEAEERTPSSLGFGLL